MDSNTGGDDYILQEMRMKYAEDLEEILECPVCLEIPNGKVKMCHTGHHLCSNCKSLLVSIGSKCPICESDLTDCRNYSIEKLCQKFEDIKTSILDPRHAINKRIIKNKTSVHVQTDEVCLPVLNNNSNNNDSSTENHNKDCAEKGDSLIINKTNNIASI